MSAADIKRSEIEKIVTEITTKAVLEEETEAFNELKLASEKFLKEIQTASYLSSTDDLITQMTTMQGKVSVFYSNMRNVYDSDYTRKVLKLQHEYENALNKFFEREIYLTYVDENGNIIAYGDEAIGKVYEKATRNAGRGNLNKKALEDVTNFNSEMDEINRKLAKSAEARRNVYLTAIYRWEFYEHNGEKEVKTANYPNENYFHRYYWQKTNNSYGESKRISSRGVIAEAYADAVINENKSLLGNLEGDSGALSALNNLIEKDNIPASLKGDIVLDSNNKIQFAVKEGNFSTAMIGQYINIAYNITKIIATNKTELILALPKLVKNNNIADGIVNAINNKGVEEAINYILSANLGQKKVGGNSWKKTVNMLKGVL